jgi:hypothetical protein
VRRGKEAKESKEAKGEDDEQPENPFGEEEEAEREKQVFLASRSWFLAFEPDMGVAAMGVVGSGDRPRGQDSARCALMEWIV